MEHQTDQQTSNGGVLITTPAILRPALGIAVVATSLMLAACDVQSGGASPSRLSSGAGTQSASRPLATVPAGDCLDGTSSSAPAYAIQMRALVNFWPVRVT